jgi:pyrroloquinoline-quinone synthase
VDIIAALDEARSACNVLEHPFYQRWSAGELQRGELSCYAGEYRHAVIALAEASRMAAAQAAPEQRRGLGRHAAEEESHVALWDTFAQAVGGDDDAPASPAEPLAQTSECAQAWTAGSDILETLAVLYAIEAGQPAVSQTKLDGLFPRRRLLSGPRRA